VGGRGCSEEGGGGGGGSGGGGGEEGGGWGRGGGGGGWGGSMDEVQVAVFSGRGTAGDEVQWPVPKRKREKSKIKPGKGLSCPLTTGKKKQGNPCKVIGKGIRKKVQKTLAQEPLGRWEKSR